MLHAPAGDTWVGLCPEPLPLAAVAGWATGPAWGAQVLFTGTVRASAAGRPGVSALEYEAYAEQVEPRLAAVAAEARDRWPGVGRLAILHRSGVLGVGEAAVVVAVASGHRAEAFEAARHCIDTVKATAPIWKRETWEGGSDWGLTAEATTSIAQGAAP